MVEEQHLALSIWPSQGLADVGNPRVVAKY